MLWIWMLYGLLGIGVMAILILLARRIHRHIEQKKLSLADYVSITATILNIVLLVLAVGSLHVAIDTYIDAKQSSEEQTVSLAKQQQTLDASRTALETVVTSLGKQEQTLEQSRSALDSAAHTAIAQNQLLAQSVKNSKEQLQILQEQWKRELEQADVRIALLYPQDPAIMIYNASKVKPVRDGLYQLISYNIDKPYGSTFQTVQTLSMPTGSIPPDGGFLPTHLDLHLTPNEPLKSGNRLFGYVSVSCAECQRHRIYWFLIRFSEEGWFREDNNDSPAFYKLVPANVESLVSEFLRHKDLIRMPKRWDEVAK